MATLLDAEIWRSIEEHLKREPIPDDVAISHIANDPCAGCAKDVLSRDARLREKLEKHYDASGREEQVNAIIEASEHYNKTH